MADKNAIEMLNEMLADEYAQFIEMATQASIVTGDQALYMREFFEKQAHGSLNHAAMLRERIFFLGGTISTKVGDVRVYPTTKEAIEAGISDHKKFVEKYRKLLSAIRRPDGDILYETVEEILEEEQKDLEAFRRLAGKLE